VQICKVIKMQIIQLVKYVHRLNYFFVPVNLVWKPAAELQILKTKKKCIKVNTPNSMLSSH